MMKQEPGIIQYDHSESSAPCLVKHLYAKRKLNASRIRKIDYPGAPWCVQMHPPECRLELTAKVACTFETDRQPQQPVSYAGRQAYLGAHGGMRHGRRMRHQRLGEGEQLQPVQKLSYRRLATGQLETDDAAETPLLADR